MAHTPLPGSVQHLRTCNDIECVRKSALYLYSLEAKVRLLEEKLERDGEAGEALEGWYQAFNRVKEVHKKWKSRYV